MRMFDTKHVLLSFDHSDFHLQTTAVKICKKKKPQKTGSLELSRVFVPSLSARLHVLRQRFCTQTLHLDASWLCGFLQVSSGDFLTLKVAPQPPLYRLAFLINLTSAALQIRPVPL